MYEVVQDGSAVLVVKPQSFSIQYVPAAMLTTTR